MSIKNKLSVLKEQIRITYGSSSDIYKGLGKKSMSLDENVRKEKEKKILDMISELQQENLQGEELKELNSIIKFMQG